MRMPLSDVKWPLCSISTRGVLSSEDTKTPAALCRAWGCLKNWGLIPESSKECWKNLGRPSMWKGKQWQVQMYVSERSPGCCMENALKWARSIVGRAAGGSWEVQGHTNAKSSGASQESCGTTLSNLAWMYLELTKERREREWIRKTFKEIMAQNCTNLVKDLNLET